MKNKIVQGPVIVRPSQTGTTDLNRLFPGVKKKIDPQFKKFVSNKYGQAYEYEQDEAQYRLFETLPGLNTDRHIFDQIYGMAAAALGPQELMANLEFLSQNFLEFLSIPEGQEELNFILGYAKDTDLNPMPCFVYFIEHEMENGQQEIHFHARPLNQWGDDCPKGMSRL